MQFGEPSPVRGVLSPLSFWERGENTGLGSPGFALEGALPGRRHHLFELLFAHGVDDRDPRIEFTDKNHDTQADGKCENEQNRERHVVAQAKPWAVAVAIRFAPAFERIGQSTV